VEEKKETTSSLVDIMLKESDAYSTMEIIHSYIQKGGNLANIPMQPLYNALKTLPPTESCQYLSLLSKEQRVVFQDLDLWTRDNIDIHEFEYWIQCFSCHESDNLRFEFVSGHEFLLFLKGRFNIWTFDSEDPQYPDHDYFFLTDDGLLLFEYDEHFGLVAEVKLLIRDLYSQWGVEKAYSFLFKLVSDGALSLIEEEYRFKKSRLADVGFVDYYDAIELDQTFAVRGQVDNFVKQKKIVKTGIHSIGKIQTLPKNALSPFKNEALSLDSDLDLVNDEKRSEYLRFNFLRLVNASISLGGSYKAGSVALHRSGQKVRNYLELGHSYLKDFALKEGLVSLDEKTSLFELFDFTEVYRLGHSLVQIELKGLKKVLRTLEFEDDDSFLGGYINEFLDNSFGEAPKLSQGVHDKGIMITTYKLFCLWEKQVDFIKSFLPFVSRFGQTFYQLKESGQISDQYYYNYNVDDIDLEAILMSSYANFRLGYLGSSENSPKLGVTLDEFKKFCSMELGEEGKLKDSSLSAKHVIEFQKAFGLESVPMFDDYLLSLLKSELEGYKYLELKDEDFRHVGGPIIFIGT